MPIDERQSLVEKIEELSPEARERVKGYVDALFAIQGTQAQVEEKSSQAESSDGNDRSVQAGEIEAGEEDSREEQANVPRFQWRGALSHLADEYTAEELQEKAKEWRMKNALDD